MKELSTHARRQIVGTIILLLIVWPAGHRLVSHFTESNPWKFCGFAMYCTVHDIRVFVVGGRDGQYQDIRQTQMSEETKSALSIFDKRRETLGRLVDPQKLAEVLLREYPDMETIKIAIKLQRLNGRTSLLKTTTRFYNYEREGPIGK